MTSLTYREALETPKRGWINASADHMQASYADDIRWLSGTAAKPLYIMANKHGIKLKEVWHNIKSGELCRYAPLAALLQEEPKYLTGKKMDCPYGVCDYHS